MLRSRFYKHSDKTVKTYLIWIEKIQFIFFFLPPNLPHLAERSEHLPAQNTEDHEQEYGERKLSIIDNLDGDEEYKDKPNYFHDGCEKVPTDE